MKIFLSYPSEQRSLADRVRQALVNEGHEVFFDRDSLLAGGNFNTAIAAELSRSELLIFFVTARSISSGSYTLMELKLAARRWPSPVHRVLPLMVESVPITSLPAYLSSVTLLQPEGEPVAEVVDSVRQMLADIDPNGAAPDVGRQLEAAGRSLGALLRLRVAQLGAAGVLAVILAVTFASDLQAAASEAVAMMRVSASTKRPPMSEKVRSNLEGTAKRLASVVQADALTYQRAKDQISPWALAQAMWALPEAWRLAPAVFAEYERQHADPTCSCWTEFIGKRGDKCVFVSGWILAALARQGLPATEGEIDFLLSQQQPGGWWAMFPAPASPDAASPYATAWVLMGMHLQQQLPTFPPSRQKSVKAAIAAGQAWLMSTREAGMARWKRYPLMPSSEISVSVSGTVLHALHALGTPDLEEVDAEWIDNLPTAGIAGGVENPYVLIDSVDGKATDHWEQLLLPWVTVATQDAYAGVSLRQRARAWRWLEATLSDPRVIASDTEQRQWWRAEILYSLYYVLNTSP